MAVFRIHGALIAIAASLLSTSLWAADGGRVLVVRGSAWLERDGVQERIIKDARVQEGDLVSTGPKSTVKWWMADDSIYTIGSNTQMRITEYKVFRASSERSRGFGRLALDFVKGSFRTITGFIGSRNRAAYSVRTPVATMGIRGTDYTAILLDADQAAARGLQPGLYVTVTSGSVEITNDSGDVLVVEPGQIGYVSAVTATPVYVTDAPPGLIDAFDEQQLKFTQEFFRGFGEDIRIEEEAPASPS